MTSNELVNIINKHVGYAEPQIYEALNEYLKFVIAKTLEIAAEKAKIERDMNGNGDFYDFINRESITNTFEETFKKFEVCAEKKLKQVLK